MTGPNKEDIYPLKKLWTLCFLKNIIKIQI
jgi:hypothetical protein